MKKQWKLQKRVGWTSEENNRTHNYLVMTSLQRNNDEFEDLQTIFNYKRCLGPSVLDLASKESSHVLMEYMFDVLHHG